MNDMDGRFPTLNEFWEEWNKVLYQAVRNSIWDKSHDSVMTQLADAFVLRYDSLCRNFHTDYGVPFSAYVVQRVKQYAFKQAAVEARTLRRYQPSDQPIDPELEAGCVTDREALEIDHFDTELRWLADRMHQGFTLRELESTSQYNYAELRALKARLGARVQEEMQE